MLWKYTLILYPRKLSFIIIVSFYIFGFINSIWKSFFSQRFHLVALSQCLLNNWNCHHFKRTKPTPLPVLGSGPFAYSLNHFRQAAGLPSLHFQAPSYLITIPTKGRDEWNSQHPAHRQAHSGNAARCLLTKNDGKCKKEKKEPNMITDCYHQVAEDSVVHTTRFESILSWLFCLSSVTSHYYRIVIVYKAFSQFASLSSSVDIKPERTNTFLKLASIVLITIFDCLYYANLYTEHLTY